MSSVWDAPIRALVLDIDDTLVDIVILKPQRARHGGVHFIGRMKVGCQDHSIEAWRNFSELEIAQMADGATNFWSKHKTMLLMLCDAYKHPSE